MKNCRAARKSTGSALLQAEAFVHEALQARPVNNVVGEFFVGKHAERRTPGIGGHLSRLFQREIGILADHRHHHAHHYLEAPQSSGFLRALIGIVFFAWWSGPLHVHANPVVTGCCYWMPLLDVVIG